MRVRSSCHKEVIEKLLTLPATTKDAGESLSSIVAEQKQCNRACFLKVLGSIRYLSRQGLALRVGGRGEVESNFVQLLKLFSEGNPRLSAWLEKKSNKYTGIDVQNKMLQIMALRILRDSQQYSVLHVHYHGR